MIKLMIVVTMAEEATLKEKLVISKVEYSMRIETMLMKLKPYVLYRWIFYSAVTFLFCFKMLHSHKFYAVGYMAGLFTLQCVVLFLSPKLDPELYGKDVLPTTADDGDYKPFVRKLPEFVLWKRITAASLLSNFASFIPFLDLPVYGPLLVFYFVLVTVMTFRTRIAHMIKYGYVPFDLGKPKYQKPSE